MSGLPAAHAPSILGPDRAPTKRGATVAKKPTARGAKGAKGSPRRPVPTQPNAIAIRGSAEWKAWLEAFAAKMRTRPTAVIDLALAKLAAQEGFEEPPPRIKP